jgi:phosphodiesterase/alkaline phosphatase D-like protein
MESNSTSVPVSIPNCFNRIAGCDNWATDGNSTTTKTFVSEREAFLKFLDDNNIKNVVFVATDIHSPAVVNISHDANEDGDNLNLYELVSGPLSAIPLASNPLDPTINATYLYNESKIFNFGHINVQRDSNADVKLIYEVIDSNGLVRPKSRLSITAQ